MLLSSAWAQKNDPLALSEAVIGAYGELRPQTLRSFQWMPEGAGYSYIIGQGDATRLVVKNASDRSHQEVTLSALNAGVTSTGYLAMRFFPSVRWQSNQELLFDYFNKVFSYHIETGATQLLVSYDDNSRHADFNAERVSIAYVLDNNLFVHFSDSTILPVTAHENQSIVSGAPIHRYEFGITKGTFWSPDGSKLAFYESDESQMVEYPVTDYRPEMPQPRNIRYPVPNMPGERPRVGIFNVESKEVKYLDGGQEEKYISHLTWGPDGQSVFLTELDRAQQHLQLVRYQIPNGERTVILTEQDTAQFVEPLAAPVFLPDPRDGFLWLSNADGYKHLYHYNSQGKLNRQITKGEFDVAEIIGFDDSGRNAIITAHHPVLERHVFSVNLRRGRMKQITNDTGLHSATLSSDNKYLMITLSSEDIPGRNDLYLSSGEFVQTLHTAENPLTSYSTGTTEIISFKAHDGSDLYGRIVKPSKMEPGAKYPVLVYVYGGPQAQLVNRGWLNGAGLWMHHLAEQGYIVFTLDNRGTANRGNHFARQTHGQLGTIEIQDQLSGVAYLKKLDYVDADNMAVYGWGYGGYLAASLMLRTPGIFKAGVAGGAMTNWRLYESIFTERHMGTLDSNEDAYDRAGLIEYADNLKGALLLMHGVSDEVVPVGHHMKLMQRFVELGVHAEQFLFPAHGHHIRGRDRLHMMERVVNFLNHNIGTDRIQSDHE